MYAVIETGGKQYRVELGTELEVESLDVQPGDDITMERVLLVADGDDSAIGRPVVENATVAAQVVRHDRGEKLISFKYGPKTRRRVKKGHRQELTVLRISDIVLGDRSAAADARAADAEARSQRERLEDAAARQAAADAALAAKLAKAAEATPKAAERGTTAGAGKGPRRRTPAKAQKATTQAPAKASTAKPTTEKADSKAGGTTTPRSKAGGTTTPRSKATGSAPTSKAKAEPAAEAKPKRARGATDKDN